MNRKLDLIITLGVMNMGIAQDLEDHVLEQTTVIGGFEQAWENLIAAVEASKGDEAQLTRTLSAAKANTARVAAKVAANTAANAEAVASPALPEVTA